MAEDKSKWQVWKVDGFDPLILTESNEKNIKAILFELHQPFTVIRCYDFLTGELLDTLTLDALY